jgi:hypothetical protein
MTFLYRTSLACGALPLIAGTAVFVAWCVSPQEWLQFAGLMVILAGCGLFVLGFVCLWFYTRKTRKSAEPQPSALRPAVLLLLNLPASAFYGFVAGTVVFADFLTIRNGLAVPIDKLTLSDDFGATVTFPSIPPGTKVYCVGPFAEGVLRYDFVAGQGARQGVLNPYVSGRETHYDLTVTPDLQVTAGTRSDPSSLSDYLRYCAFR